MGALTDRIQTGVYNAADRYADTGIGRALINRHVRKSLDTAFTPEAGASDFSDVLRILRERPALRKAVLSSATDWSKEQGNLTALLRRATSPSNWRGGES
jgi:hypothetical protein